MNFFKYLNIQFVYIFKLLRSLPPSFRSDDGVNEKKIDSELAALLSHPALKNVDLKMVELISNEIIHKFKPVGMLCLCLFN